ncbi:transposase [Elizabethkingia argentiflava]|uniref:Transposase n=2 Tax=Elizabethkingia argenteiflava TaxID=2681556 RepID=A0A845PWP9_9FLAO|nr:transposase [Elizabethkingia argenteiflava]
MSEHEAVQNVSDIWREHGITQGTYYSCKSKYSGMKVSQLKQLGEIEKEL